MEEDRHYHYRIDESFGLYRPLLSGGAVKLYTLLHDLNRRFARGRGSEKLRQWVYWAYKNYLASEGDGITAGMGCGRNQLRAYLRELADNKLVEMEGFGRGRRAFRFRIVDPLPKPGIKVSNSDTLKVSKTDPFISGKGSILDTEVHRLEKQHGLDNNKSEENVVVNLPPEMEKRNLREEAAGKLQAIGFSFPAKAVEKYGAKRVLEVLEGLKYQTKAPDNPPGWVGDALKEGWMFFVGRCSVCGGDLKKVRVLTKGGSVCERFKCPRCDPPKRSRLQPQPTERL